jgi:hypothetical protein
MALPPAASISAPAADASGWLLTTMPRLPDAGCFRQLKTVFVRSRQLPFMHLVLPSVATASCLADIRLAPNCVFSDTTPDKKRSLAPVAGRPVFYRMARCLMIGDLQGVW